MFLLGQKHQQPTPTLLLIALVSLLFFAVAVIDASGDDKFGSRIRSKVDKNHHLHNYRLDGDYENDDLMFSDTRHGDRQSPSTAAAEQHVLFIDHGNGAVSQIRRTQFLPTRLDLHHQPEPPALIPPEPVVGPFGAHIDRYDHQPNRHGQEAPNSNRILTGGFPLTDPNSQGLPNPNSGFGLFPSDIPRLFQRRVGDGADKRTTQPTPPTPSIPSTPAPLIQPNTERAPKVPPQQHHPAAASPQSDHQNRPQEEPPQFTPFFNLNQPDYFPFFDSPFAPAPIPLFQRRRLANDNANSINDNGVDHLNELHPNSIGYPSYTYYKGGGEDNPTLNNWPKIFKFTDGRANLNEFEKMKKHGKIKFNSQDDDFDNISRESFLILHGGTYTH